jgi:hypothetical protein
VEQLGDAVLGTQGVQHDPDLVFRREMPPGRPANVLHHLLGRLLGIQMIRSHLRSFPIATRPKHSSNHNSKFVP